MPYSYALILDSTKTASYPGTGNVWYDISGNGRDFTFVTAPPYVSNRFEYSSGSSPNYAANSSYNFTNLTGSPAVFSFEFWIWINGSYSNGGSYRFPFSNYDGSNGGFILAWERPNASGTQSQQVFFGFDSGGTFYQTVGSSGNLTLQNQWIHVVIVKDGASYKLYQNASLIQSVTQPTSLKAPSTSTSSIFGVTDTGSAGFDGKLTYVAVFTQALTAGEVTDLYNQGLPQPGPGPTPYTPIVGGRTFGQGFAG